jgi:hypothetical protein
MVPPAAAATPTTLLQRRWRKHVNELRLNERRAKNEIDRSESVRRRNDENAKNARNAIGWLE